MKINGSKRGETLPMRVVVVMVLLLLAGTLIALFYTGVYRDVSLAADRSLCQTSVRAAEATSFAGLDSPINLEGCDTRVLDINFGNKDKEKKDRLFKVEVDSEEKLAATISEELGGCAWQFGEGESNPFGSYSRFGDNVRCIVCSEFSVSPEIVQSFDTVDVSTYMKENPFKSKEVVGVSKPYSEMLGFGTEFPPLALEKDTYPVDYSVIFALGQTNPIYDFVTTPSSALSAGGAAFGCVKAGLAGFALGSAVPVAGNLVGGTLGVLGCVVGGSLGAGAGYVVGSGGDKVKDAIVEDEYFEAFKSYDYFFVQDHQKKEGYTSVFAIVPSTALGDNCNKLY
jgi:hypothetical protein